MINLTASAAAHLQRLIREHPEDPVVRVALKDLDETRLAVNITLEDHAREDDQVQTLYGLTVAVDAHSAARLDAVTLDFHTEGGFTITHPPAYDDGGLNLIHLN